MTTADNGSLINDSRIYFYRFVRTFFLKFVSLDSNIVMSFLDSNVPGEPIILWN